MKARDERESGGVALEEGESAELLTGPVQGAQSFGELPAIQSSLVIGELVAITDEGRTPLVMYPGQPGSAAVRARAVVDLHGAHIGREVALAFESQSMTPVVMGVLRDRVQPLAAMPGTVEVEADGERMIVSAHEQIVLQCGKASITLTKAGKVLIQGEYVSSRSSGVNRIKGGSIQLN